VLFIQKYINYIDFILEKIRQSLHCTILSSASFFTIPWCVHRFGVCTGLRNKKAIKLQATQEFV